MSRSIRSIRIDNGNFYAGLPRKLFTTMTRQLPVWISPKLSRAPSDWNWDAQDASHLIQLFSASNAFYVYRSRLWYYPCYTPVVSSKYSVPRGLLCSLSIPCSSVRRTSSELKSSKSACCCWYTDTQDGQGNIRWICSSISSPSNHWPNHEYLLVGPNAK